MIEASPKPGSMAWLFEDRDELFAELDLQDRIAACNGAWSALGWTPEDLAGRGLVDFVHPDDWAALTTGAAAHARLMGSDGGWRRFAGRIKRAPAGGVVILTADSEDKDQTSSQDVQGGLAKAAGVWTWTFDPANNHFRMWGSTAHVSEGPVEDIEGMLALMHPADREGMGVAMARVIETGEDGAATCRVKALSGEWLHFHCSYRAEDIDGRRLIHGLTKDISDQAHTRDKALEAAERLRIALNAAHAGVSEIDFEAQTVWSSEEFVQIVGQPMPLDMNALEPWPMCHPDDRAHLEAMMARWTGPHHEPVEIRIVLPDGGVRWVELHGERRVTENGELARITGLVLDIDARKQQELALVEARAEAQANAARLKLAMDAARAGVFETDFDTREFWCSPEFEAIVGRRFSFDEAAGIWPTTHPDDVERVSQAIADSGGGDLASAEWRILTPSGEYRWIEARAIVHAREDGSVRKLVGVVVDIHERKVQELALVEAEQAAQAAVEAKSQFLANMSHEIRTPMNGILGVLHLLESEPMREDARRLLDEAGNCGRMLSQLLNDVIDLSRIEAGRLDLTPEPLDPRAVLESVAGLLRPQAEAKGVKLEVEVQGPGGFVMADPVRLRQALFNLIGNAVKFTVEGKVAVRLLGRPQPDGRVRMRFEVRDTGVGIPLEAQNSLFRRFTQVDGSTARRFGGSGLGLAITRLLADLMDGEVGFTSEEGRGSTFWFDFPAPAAVAPERAPAAASLGNGMLNGARLLVVEDNPTNRLVASRMLASLGASVDTADDGVDGLSAVQAGAYDLVLMDVQMPRMDGVEATRRIRALDDARALTPIIGLTANVLTQQTDSYREAGMDGVVAKPISPAALVAEIARVFESCADRAQNRAPKPDSVPRVA